MKSAARLALLFPLLAAAFASAAPAVLLSGERLLLEVEAEPYRYRLIDRDTGSVVLAHRESSFRRKGRTGRLLAAAVEEQGPDGVRLRVGSPAGGLCARVRFSFAAPQVLRVEVSCPVALSDRERERKSFACREVFQDAGQHYYGVSMYPAGGGLDNRGRRLELEGGHLLQKGGDWFSVRAPFYFTRPSAGATGGSYGIWVNSSWRGRFAFALAGETWFEFDDSSLDYYVFCADTCSELLGLYARPEYGGPSLFPPLWAMTTLWWRDDFHEDLRGPGGKLQDMGQVVLNDLAELTRLQVPVAAVMLDRPHSLQGPRDEELPGWGTLESGRFRLDFPRAAEVLRRVREAGVQVLCWTANRVVSDAKAEAKASGFTFPGYEDAVDVRLPEAWVWWQEKLSVFSTDYGIQGHMIDRGEETGLLVSLGPLWRPRLKRVREVPEFLANENAALFPQLVAETLSRYWGEDHYVYTRSGYDRSRRVAGVWNGDARGWKGLRESVKHLLRAGLILFPLWGSDVGGYKHPILGWKRDDELWVRWAQFAAWSPHMHLVFGPGRTPWLDFAKEHLEAFRQSVRLKHDLLPYYRSLLHQAAKTGMPVARPLFLEFGQAGADDGLADRCGEYLFGPEFLVAPITRRGQRLRAIELPSGGWLDYAERRAVYEGGRRIRLPAPLQRIPVLVREGAIVPRGDIARFNNTWTADWKPRLSVELYPSRRRANSFPYFTGTGVSRIALDADAVGVRVSWEPLGTDGVMRIYCTRPDEARLDGRRLGPEAFSYDPDQSLLELPFSGGTAGELALRGSRGPWDR